MVFNSTQIDLVSAMGQARSAAVCSIGSDQTQWNWMWHSVRRWSCVLPFIDLLRGD